MRYAGYDLFQKQVDGLRTKTITGAIISIIAASVTFVLFLSQVYLYFKFNVSDHLTIAVPDRFRSLEALIASRAHPSLLLNLDGRGKFRNASPIILHLHVTFPHIKCQDLDIFHNGASGEDFRRMHGKNAVTFRAPNREELLKVALDTKAEDGCTIQGKFAVPKVSGSFGVSVARSSWQVILMNAMFHMTQRHEKHDKKAYDPFAGGPSQTGKSFNVTHYIHTVDFGNTAVFSHHPLRDVREVVSNESGLGVASISIKLIPTKYKRFWRKVKNMFQISVSRHFINPSTLAARSSNTLPGIAFMYDFTPLEVRRAEEREGFLSFLANLISIVGGVFVTVRLVGSFLVETVNISKKRD